MSGRVFISYARVDAAFATWLTEHLRAIDCDVWLDEEQLPVGSRFEERIVRALHESDAAVFIVSAAWLERDWTRYELKRFADSPEKKRIGILRDPRLDPGPHLASRQLLNWFDDDPAESLVWQLHCGLEDLPPGPRRQWAERGKKLLASGDPEADSESSLAHGSSFAIGITPASRRSNLHLLCGRGEQWTSFFNAWSHGQNRLIVVSGERGEAHEKFLERAERFIPHEPARRVLRPDWSGARTARDYLGAFASELNCSPSLLARRVAEELQVGHLLVLLPLVSNAFNDPERWQHLSRDLPKLCEKRSPFALRAVLPVEWRATLWPFELLAACVRWFSPGPSPQLELYLERRRAVELIGRLAKGSGAHAKKDPSDTPVAIDLATLELERLRRIDRKDLKRFCELFNLDEERTSRFITNVLFRARNSQEILESVQQHLPAEV